MKLSDHITSISAAFEALLSYSSALDPFDQPQHDHTGRRIRRDLPRHRTFDNVPQIPHTYSPMTHSLPIHNKEKLLQLATFEATYNDAKTPISADMVPLIIDTGASITVSPCKTDFISPIWPVQNIEIKGIASGLQVCGFGDISYTFYNDERQLQTMILKGCLYVPQCTARLLCPRQLGQTTGHSSDGFIAMADKTVLVYQGKQTTITYDTISNLPILYTASGISSFHRFCANQHYVQQLPSVDHPFFLPHNLTPKQQRKLHLHERCAHANWEQINAWIRTGNLPGGPSLASEPDPICAVCQFGKAHKRSHKADTGNISNNHLAPGDGVSSDGMEAGCPGRMMTTHGLPSLRRYKYVSFWVDHYSQFVYITMHKTKKAEELLKSKFNLKNTQHNSASTSKV
jgi:hypothetical protein